VTARSAKAENHEEQTSPEHGGRQMPTAHLPQLRVPAPGNVLWWGGLAAVAAFGVVDWPVAALVAAGTWVAEQHAKAARRPDGNRAEAR
jgi:hypothetical protein